MATAEGMSVFMLTVNIIAVLLAATGTGHLLVAVGVPEGRQRAWVGSGLGLLGVAVVMKLFARFTWPN